MAQPKGFDDMGRVGASKAYVNHLIKFSQLVKPNHTFIEVMRAAAQVSPSVRYHILSEYSKRNAGNIPTEVKKHCESIKKEMKNVILMPKEKRGKTNQQKQG